MPRYHRPSAPLTGKNLSAHTLASFTVAQGLNDPRNLAADQPMDAACLGFLNRSKAIGYWHTNGWLEREDDRILLTDSGLAKVRSRLAGEAGAQSVSVAAVLQAVDLIQRGAGSPAAAGLSLESAEFPAL